MSQGRASSFKTRSRVGSSKTSSVSNAAAIARAKAEAAKARNTFAEQEIELKLQQACLDTEKASLDAEKARQQACLDEEKARLEATLQKLAIEKETAAAIAETLEAAVYSDDKHSRRSSVLGLQQVTHDPLQRTVEYVHQHSKSNDDPDPQAKTEHFVNKPSQPDNSDPQKANYQSPYQKQGNTHWDDTDYNNLSPEQKIWNLSRLKENPFASERYYSSWTKPETSNRYDRTAHMYSDNTPSAGISANQATMDFAKFLARRELVTKGLVKFSDRAENYRAWRASFKNTISDIGLSCSEEMDLLVKWLGSESAEHAKRIRDINVNYPDVGLKRIWNRLDECYGSVEVIESALFKRIEDFPRIANKDYSKLRELTDLIMELCVAKAEGDLVGLTYLDTARGVNPIVQKLPYNLQGKWVTYGSKYKQAYNVPFPPFNVFVDFVSEQAKIRNDPSYDFMLSCANISVSKPRRTTVEVHKTNISSTGSVRKEFSSGQGEDKSKDPSRQCPLHKKPHSLLKCRAFKEKSLEERKAFLKENRICYKCCSSTSHFARDCEVSARCTECDSTEHNSVLHPVPLSDALPQEHSGELNDSNTDTPAITSKCTEVCGNRRQVLL
ncbi:uncharacterized protein [Dendrobates tinctorius]|uniref:uncharacterized protein n=1 Tax=Dendrobates tinctorius TaxID=92724 RepID=UPI003CC93486